MKSFVPLLCVLGVVALLAGASAQVKLDLVEGGMSSGTIEAGSSTPSIQAESVQTRKVREGAEEFMFQAEVNRLMDIIIHSLYSNKDIFLRELISNASDALDKIRFLALTDKTLLGDGEVANLEIKIHLDKENNILYIRDRGLGMTKDDLIKNLGTIAKSGTSAFVEQMQKGGDSNLIGQFGVGFYSVYLVADWVEVVSKHNDDVQYIWSSGAEGSFSVIEDTENEPLGRGTLIKLHLKPECQEYAEESKLKDLVTKYSEFINFPIYLHTTKEVEVPVEEEAEEVESEEATEEGEEEASSEEDDVEDEEEAAEEEAPKTRKEMREEWELLNDNKAIWLRQPSDVTDEEYQKFYKAVSKDHAEAMTWSHFKAEGDVEFKAILYIPSHAPYDFFDKYYEKAQASVKLYVRRVFISDDFKDLLPRFLSFIKGLVDSDTLPLNVSREMLQASAALKTIKKKLVRKVLDMIKGMAEDEVKCNDEEVDEADKPAKEKCEAYPKFWREYGKALKMGVIEDSTNRNRIAKLLRFTTSKSGQDKTVSLDQYIARMKEGQKEIYFLTGTSVAELEKSPFLERLLKKGYEVVYLTDVLDEYLMQHLLEYDDKKFQDAAKEDLKMSDKDEQEKKKDKELKEEFKDLTKWWKDTLGSDKVSNVKVSTRLHSTPCVVVVPKYAQSANMERIMASQAFSNQHGSFGGSKVLEINPRHPLISALKESVTADSESESAKETAKLLFDTALLESGFSIADTKQFSGRMYALLQKSLGLEGELNVEDEAEEVEEEVEVQEEEAEEEADAPEHHDEL